MSEDRNTQTTKQTDTGGALNIPQPPDVATRRALDESLKGHTTSAAWLPEGLWPELDDLRSEQLRLRGQVASELEALRALKARFRKEDAEHEEGLLQAQRDGEPASAEDRRTSPEERAAERAAIEERLWAGVRVFAEHADRIIETVRHHETEWLADLRSRLTPAQEKRRRAQELVAEAKAEEWHLYRLGQWLQTTADDIAFGRQPAPEVAPVPQQLSADVVRESLERPWHKVRPWSGAKKGGAA